MVNCRLKVVLVTQGLSPIVEPVCSSNNDIVGIIEAAPRVAKNSDISCGLRIVKKIYHIFNGRSNSLAGYADNRKIPYLFMESSDNDNVISWLKNKRPDVVVVFSMSRLLKECFLAIPRYGVINLHPSLLPAYRGPNPDFWQYYNMEMNPGVTVHYLDKGEDTGDIIFQASKQISLGIKSPARLDMLINELGIPLVLKALTAIQAGNAPRIKQPKTSPTSRARNLLPEEHKTIIDWHNWPIKRIWHILRGTERWLKALPQPTGLYIGHLWVIGEYERFAGQTVTPGLIYKNKGQYCVAVKEGCIYLSLSFSFKKIILRFLKK
ncbi:MAG TPA: methionyl-tRNA formyltransferase [Arsenophonus sp.]